MKKILVDEINKGDIAAFDVYDNSGNELIKKGTTFKESSKKGLKKAGIYFVYTSDNETTVHAVYRQKTIAGIMKVMKYYLQSNGENTEILKRYDKKEIERFLSASNETGNKIAYSHIFRYFAADMVSSLNENPKQVYDFQDYRNRGTYQEYHCVNTSCIAGVMAHNMGLKDEEIIDVITGSLMNDLKMNLYKFVNEKRILAASEKEELKQHPFLSFDFVRKIYNMPARAALISMQHHERYDGSGYPKGLKGSDISVMSRIVMIADVYDAMTSSRPYRKAFNPSDAWQYVVLNKGVLFDPAITEEFKRSIPKYFPGDIIELNGQETGIVTGNQYEMAENPSIKIIEKKDKSVIISCNRKNQTLIRTLESIRQKEQ